MAKTLLVLIVACGLQMSASAQENSPYSRYGLGDLTPNQNVFSRGMGGISAGVVDNLGINFTNPASLPYIASTIFDIGTEIDYRILKSTNPAKKFTSANTYVNYLQLAFPLTTPKMKKKGMLWAMNIGLKPVSKINYKIEKSERLTGIDSTNTLYEGSGGVNQAFLGTGLLYKNFSIGINAGYMFGSKDISTVVSFVNDTTFYYTGNYETKTTFGSFFINGGLQYSIDLAKEKNVVTKKLTIGVYGNLQQNLKANSDKKRETVFYDQDGNITRIDSVYAENNVKGNIKYPARFGAGFAYQDMHWLVGADWEFGNWSNYRYYGQTDQVQNNWTIRAGAQYTPSLKHFNAARYRAGLYYGSDYIKTTNDRPEYGFTIGAGFPLTTLKANNVYPERGFVRLNTALEIGNRGNKQTNLRENVVRFSIGVTMSAGWFQKRKYF